MHPTKKATLKFLRTKDVIAISNEGTKLTDQYFMKLQEGDFVSVEFMYDKKQKKTKTYYAMVMKSYGSAVDIVAFDKDKDGKFIEIGDKGYKGKVITVGKNQVKDLVFLQENHKGTNIFGVATDIRMGMASGGYSKFVEKLRGSSNYQKTSFEIRNDKFDFVKDTRPKTRRLGLSGLKNSYSDKEYHEWLKKNESLLVTGKYNYESKENKKYEDYANYYWTCRHRKDAVRQLTLGDMVQFKKKTMEQVGGSWKSTGEIEIVAPFVGYRNGYVIVDTSYVDKSTGDYVQKHDEINIYNNVVEDYKPVITATYRDVTDTATMVRHLEKVKEETKTNFDAAVGGKVTRETILKPTTIGQYYNIQQFAEEKDASDYKAIASLQRGDVAALELDLTKYDNADVESITKYYIVVGTDEDTGFPILATSSKADYNGKKKTFYKEFPVNPDRIVAIGRNKVANPEIGILANQTLVNFTDKIMEASYNLSLPKVFETKADADKYIKNGLNQWYEPLEVNLSKNEKYSTSIKKYFKFNGKKAPAKAYILTSKKFGGFFPNSDVHTFPMYVRNKDAIS